jgi:hypothetical protein
LGTVVSFASSPVLIRLCIRRTTQSVQDQD